MKSIRELTDNKPSNAIFAIIDGLNEQSTREDFQVSMVTFGNNKGDICFGCAATCAIQKISGINLNAKNIDCTQKRAKALNFDISELEIFENIIDLFRSGAKFPKFQSCISLQKFYGINNYIIPDEELPQLNSWDWHENLQPYINYANKLKGLGL